MEIFNANQQYNNEMNNLLQKIKYKIEHESFGKDSTFFPYITIRNNKPVYHESTKNLAIFKKLEDLGVIKIDKRDLGEMNKTFKKNNKLKNESIIVEGYIIKIIEQKFSKLCDEYEKKVNEINLTDNRKLKLNLSFNNNKSTLSFNNKEIKISKTRNSNGHYLLKTIFKNKSKIWGYDEIADDWTDTYEKDDWTRYYNAGYKVNITIAIETTIKDFLIITNKTACINKKYL